MHLPMAIGAAIAFAIGGVFMKASNGFSQPVPSLLVYVLFLLGASFQILATRDAGMGITYILVLGLEAILAVFLSFFLLKEEYSFVKLFGVLLVTTGIALLRSNR